MSEQPKAIILYACVLFISNEVWWILPAAKPGINLESSFILFSNCREIDWQKIQDPREMDVKFLWARKD